MAQADAPVEAVVVAEPESVAGAAGGRCRRGRIRDRARHRARGRARPGCRARGGRRSRRRDRAGGRRRRGSPIVAEPVVAAEPVVIAEPELVEPSRSRRRSPPCPRSPPSPRSRPSPKGRRLRVRRGSRGHAPEPVAPVVDDVVQQPTWRMVAPDPTPRRRRAEPASAPGRGNLGPDGRPAVADPPRVGREHVRPQVSRSSVARPRRQAGSKPCGPSRPARSWSPARLPTVPSAGVQPCVSCGLSLSATARFCRRCGTSQLG